MRNALYLAAILPALFSGCALFKGPRVPEAPPVREGPRVSWYTPTPRPVSTEVPTPTITLATLPVELPEECEKVINDVKLTDILKHRQLVSIALQLEFKGRLDEAIVVLQEALKYRPNNELTYMKLAQLMDATGRRVEMGEEARPRKEATPVPRVEQKRVLPPPGLELPDDYLDIVNNVTMGNCTKGFKLFVMGGRLEDEEEAEEALFIYRKAVSLCPEEDGPNATINRQARARITALEKSIKSEKDTKEKEEK